ncbi:MAG: type II toxin-antitoxin system VapC family toxin [Burkholderiales bacterium]
MARAKKIVDASVLVKCFVHEQGSEEAKALLQEHAAGNTLIIVPELLFSEILNVLRYKNLKQDDLIAANDILWNAQLHVERTNQSLLTRAVELALKHKLSVYDATYLALAELFGSPLYTADEKLAKCPNAVRL